MADPNLPEYKRFTITSKKDPVTGSFPVPDYTKDVQAFAKAIESALPKGAFYYVGEKYVNKLGQLSQDFFTYPEHASAVSKSLRYEAGRLGYKGGDQKYKVIARRGELDEGTRYNIREAELAPQRAEEEKLAKQQEKDAQKRAKEEEKRLRQQEREEQKKEKEAQKKAKEEEREKERQQKAEERESREHFRHAKSFFLKVLGVLTVLTDVVRRILSAVIDFATQSQKDMIQAHNLGMSYETVRAFRNTEISHGMREGVLTEGVSDIQTKFGNITKLDEKSIEDLAVVMGGKVKEMVNVALNEQSPEKAMGMVLDAFMEKANAGYNSVGQYVGEQNARRELYSYLLRISPAWAEIFATMQEEQHNINSLFRNQASTFEEWRKLLPTSRGDHTSMEYNVNVTMGEEWNIVKGILEQIKQSIGLALAPQLLTLLRRIADTRVGLSETENRERNIQNETANAKAIKQTRQTISDMTMSGQTKGADAYYLQALKYYLAELEQAQKGDIKGNIHPVVKTPEEIRYMAQQIAEAKARQSLGQVVVPESGSGVLGLGYRSWEAENEILPEASEIADVLNAYKSKFDLDKEKEAYKADVRSKVASKYAEQMEAEKNRQEGLRASKQKEAQEEVFKDKTSPYYYKAGDTKHFDSDTRVALATVERLYNTELIGSTLAEKLAYAEKQNYVYKDSKNTFKVKYPEVNLDYFDRLIDEQTEQAMNEENFLRFVYLRNKASIEPHILNKREEEAREAIQTGTVGAGLMVMNEIDWRRKIEESFPLGSYGTVIGENVKQQGGEVVYVIKADIGNGAPVTIWKGEGMMSKDGEFFNFNVTDEGVKFSGKTVSNSTSGTSASKAYKSLPRKDLVKSPEQAMYYNK